MVSAVVFGAFALSGCQSNPAPPPLEATSESSSPLPNGGPTEAAPTLPPEAGGTSKAAAKAFVRHYIEAVNYAMRTGDTAQVRSLAGPSCSTCDAIIDRIDEVYAAGGRLDGAGWTVLTLSHIPNGSAKTRPLVAAAVDIAPQTAYETKDAAPSQSPRSRGNLDFTLNRTPSGWYVRRLEATQ